MPGVPSCKGCVTCAKQKKKCDQQKPSCSRCSRLKIPCVGAGEQRYKFVGSSSGKASRASSSPASTSISSTRSSLSRSPSNNHTLEVLEFTHKLQVKDLRYDLCWSYGELLREIPKRLGSNAALDASASALSSAMSGLSAGNMSQETFAKFGSAVKALRVTLADPGFVYTPETLCAVFLIWICQSWFGEVDDMVGHGAGIVRILSYVNVSNDGQDEFEKLLLLTIAGPVAFESLYDPTAKLNPWLKAFVLGKEQAMLNSHDPDEDAFKPRSVRYMGFLTCLIQLPDLLPYDPSRPPEIQEVYESLHNTTQAISFNLSAAAAKMTESYTDESIRQFALCQKAYALNLSLELILIGVLHVYNPYDVCLHENYKQVCQEVIEICLQGSVWRPLGSGWSTICLASAWVAVTDAAMRPEIEEAWKECRTYASGQLLSSAYCLLGTSFDRLKLAAWGSSVAPPPPPL